MNTSLAGLRIVVTRAPAQARDTAARIQELGGTPIVLPCLLIVPIRSRKNLNTLVRIEEFDWWVFTSVNAVNVSFQLLGEAKPVDPGQFATTSVAVVGEQTRAALAAHGVEPILVASPASAVALVRQLADIGIGGKRILVPGSSMSRPALREGLQRAGAMATSLPVYDTVAPDSVTLVEAQAVRAGAVDVITFASPSAVRNFNHLIEDAPLERVTIAAIGTTTASELASVGLQPGIVPAEASIDSLLDAIANHHA